jgi:ribose transport system permease protein
MSNKKKFPIKTLLENPNIRYWVAPILLLVAVCFAHSRSHLPLLESLGEILIYAIQYGTPLCLFAIGASLVISTGGIDLSSAGVATMSGILYALMLKFHWHWSLALFFCICFGIFSGGLVGYSVTKRFAPALIFTWALGLVYFNSSLIFADGTIVKFAGAVRSGISGGCAISFNEHLSLYVLGGLLLLVSFINYTGIQRKTVAVGANRDSATYAGISVRKTVIWSYVISAVLSALGGIFYFYVFGTARTGELQNQELIAIAVAVIGGTSLSGGYVNLQSVLFGGLFYYTLKSGLNNLHPNTTSDMQQQVINLAFSIVFILISFFIGKKLNGVTHSIQIFGQTKNQ